MSHLEKVRFLSVNYSRLQGLKAVPMGLMLFLVMLWTNGQTGPARDITQPLIWLFAAAGVYGLIDWYYRRTYGRVEQTRKSFWADVVLSTISSLIALAALIIDVEIRMLLSLFALVFAAGLLLDYFRMLRLAGVKNQTIFPAGLLCNLGMALSAFLPLLGEKALAIFGFRSLLFLVFTIEGILTTIYGMAGHIYLVRSLAPAREVCLGQPV